jgi:signal peptidase I
LAKKKVQAGIFEYIKSLAIALVLAIIIKTSIVEAYKIPSSSMEDTLLIGDFILANKFLYGARLPLIDWRFPAIRNPQPGDVIIFKYPVDRKTNYIKRCVAIEGQEVALRDKVLYVDNKRFPDASTGKYTQSLEGANPADPRVNFGPYRVPAGCIFAMGDNRDNSSDSRYWGPVPLDLVQGEALVIHWSWEPDVNAPVISLADMGSIPSSVWYNVLHFFQRVRWERLGSVVR